MEELSLWDFIPRGLHLNFRIYSLHLHKSYCDPFGGHNPVHTGPSLIGQSGYLTHAGFTSALWEVGGFRTKMVLKWKTAWVLPVIMTFLIQIRKRKVACLGWERGWEGRERRKTRRKKSWDEDSILSFVLLFFPEPSHISLLKFYEISDCFKNKLPPSLLCISKWCHLQTN